MSVIIFPEPADLSGNVVLEFLF
jgi:hypothetical protein